MVDKTEQRRRVKEALVSWRDYYTGRVPPLEVSDQDLDLAISMVMVRLNP